MDSSTCAVASNPGKLGIVRYDVNKQQPSCFRQCEVFGSMNPAQKYPKGQNSVQNLKIKVQRVPRDANVCEVPGGVRNLRSDV